uniref:shugoshin 2 isoform X2 n=1 Tax=Jaculus jaculus TaxID=51337 RepID=UPI001E1B3E7F|nr:shugoshin 2 isoform X2 [Jaculus jaculus]
MEYSVMDDDSVISGIKRRVKDKRISKTKLNVSLASKIKTKIINNSSILKISLKHNNRALAQALSREKENSRRITTEKMLLQKEVEKLNFENTFLRLKLNNLNKKLIEIESLVNNNLITAIEMSSLAEFHQSSFLPSTTKKKRISKQCNLMRLPFARVPLTSNDDDEDDGDGDDGKQKAQCKDSVMSRTTPGIPSLVSTRRPSSSPQCDLKVLLPEEDNQSPCGLHHSEHTFSTVDVLPKESHHHTDQSSSSLVSEMKITLSTSPRRETPSLSNVTERKKRGSSWESKNPTEDTPSVTDLNHQQISNSGLNWNNEINACTNEKNGSLHRDGQCFPALPSMSAYDPDAENIIDVQSSDNFQLQKTVHEPADMDLTASDASKIIAVSKGIKHRSKKKANCGMETLRKVKDPSSEKKRERAKRKCKNNSSDEDNKEKTENGPEGRPIVIDDKRDSEGPNFIFNTEQLTQANTLKKITLQNGFDQDDKQNVQFNKSKPVHIANEQDETYCFSQVSDQFLQESQFDMCQNSLTCNNKSKVSRQTFVIHKLEKDSLFSNPKDKDTISEDPEVPNEFPTADLSARDSENLHETQKMLDLKKYATVTQPALQNTSKVTKLKQKISRRTKIISKTNQMYEDNDENVHGSEKGNIFHQPQESKVTVSGDTEVSREFQIPVLFTTEHGNLRECGTQNGLGLQNQISDTYPVQQNESKISKNFRQKVNRKTEIISEANHFNNDKSMHFSEKDNSFYLLNDKVILGNLNDASDFQTPALCTEDNGKLCDYKTHTVCGIKTHAYDCQNDSKIDQKLRQKVRQKTEIISVVNQIYENDDRGVHDLQEDNFSLTREDRETWSEKPAHEFQTADLPTKYGDLCDQKAQNVLDLQKHVTSMQLTQPDVSKLNKLRPKASMTKIISEMNHIYEDTDVVNGQNYTNDPDFKINKSKQKLECQDIISGYYMEMNNYENRDQVPDPHKLVKKRRQRSSSRAKNSLVKDKNRPSFQLPDSSKAPISFGSSLKHVTNYSDSNAENNIKHPKNQKRKTVTLNTKRDALCLEEVKEGNCPAKKVSKVTSKSKSRKTLFELSSVALPELIPDTIHKQSLDSGQTDKENYLENDKIVKMKPDHCTKVVKPLSQICSPNIQNSSFDSICESLIPLGITSNKNWMIEEKFALVSSPIFQVNDVEHEKIKEGNRKVKRRTQISEIGNRMFKDLTDTTFVSSNTAKFDTELEDPPPELGRRKRKCAPVNLKEPSLARKMRR